MTSTRSVVRRASSSARASSASRASIAASSRSRTAFSAIPVSRSRTSRSACLIALFRPRYSTRTASISSVDDRCRGGGKSLALECVGIHEAVERTNALASLRRACRPTLPRVALYDSIAEIYDPWSASVVEDIAFYVDEARVAAARSSSSPSASGRIAVPIAQAGMPVIGVDLSEGMLAVARALAEEHGVGALVDLRVGDLREPPVDERVPLVDLPVPLAAPHARRERRSSQALRAARELLEPGGRLVFDVFAPSSEDIAETHGHLARAGARDLRAGRLGRERPDAHGCRCGRASRRRRWSCTGSRRSSGAA